MAEHTKILEERTFRMLPEDDIGFAKPALRFRTPDGDERTKLAARHKAPEPELARASNDPGWWTITAWLPVGSVPIALVADPDGPSF